MPDIEDYLRGGKPPASSDIHDYLRGETSQSSTGQPMTKQWKPITVEVELPSGNVATLRPLGFDLVFRSVRIPDFLTPMIVKAFKGEAVENIPLEDLNQSLEFFDMLDSLCELAFVSPRVVSNPQADDEISPDQIDFQDKTWVMNMIGKPTAWLAMFHPGSQAHVQPVGNEQNLPDSAEQTAEAEEAPAP